MEYLLLRTVSVIITSYITKVGVPLVFSWQTGWIAFLVALFLAVINHTIKPIIQAVAFPITILTLGGFSFVINGLMILLADWVIPGFSVPSLWMAIVFAFVLSCVNWVVHLFEKI